MEPERLEDIKTTIHNFKEDVPSGRSLLNNIDNLDIEQLLSVLNEVFHQEEKAIEKENSKKFTTDNYENNVRHFAKLLIASLIKSHDVLKTNDNYRKLLRQRHIAYGFYSNHDNQINQRILKESVFEKTLYSGLVDFYMNFYGSFSDNQEAIRLLCGCYPKNDDLENKEEIVSALFRHITNAGTPSDVGYAFGGIRIIQENIGHLPLGIIDQLLQKYELYRIINSKVHRHQVFTIIDNASFNKKEERQRYKFSYLDSLLIADAMNDSLFERYGKQENLSRYYLRHEIILKADKIELIFNNDNKSTYAYWTNECSFDRSFVIHEVEVINIHLYTDRGKVIITYLDNSETEIDFEFAYDDWLLDHYYSKEVEKKLIEFVYANIDENMDYAYRPLTFSLLYLHHYRGLNEQIFDFDHRFTYDKHTRELKSMEKTSDISYFYGKRIHSLSCIVGMNGTGKTSTVDFLRGTFFRLLRLIKDHEIPCRMGYIDESHFEAYNIVDKNSLRHYKKRKPRFFSLMKVNSIIILNGSESM